MKADLPPDMGTRLMAKVQLGPSECVLFTGSRNPNGYGHMQVRGRTWKAHRVSYTLANGPIPDGMQLDHLCRNRACINPDHLDVVTPRENTIRGLAHRTRCPHGHMWSPENTQYRANGARRCRPCNVARLRARRVAGTK